MLNDSREEKKIINHIEQKTAEQDSVWNYEWKKNIRKENYVGMEIVENT